MTQAPRIAAAILAIAVVFSLSGCKPPDEEATYGQRTATPLEEAVFDNSPTRVRAELKYRLPQDFKNRSGVNLLRFAVSDEVLRVHRDEPIEKVVRNSDEIVVLLLDAGVEVNAPSSLGEPVLFSAVGNQRVAVVRELIRRGAILNFEDEDRPSPLMRAVSTCHLEMIRLLVDSGADVEFSTSFHTSVESTARESCPEAIPLIAR
jgi:hypothetical protein